MTTLKEDIQKELDTYRGKTFSNSEDAIEWLRGAMERIANKTANALEVEERGISETIRLTSGWRVAIKKQKENKDNYLK